MPSAAFTLGQSFQNHVCCFQFGAKVSLIVSAKAKVSLIASASGISRAKAFKRMSDAFTFCKNSKVRKKMAYETLQRSRVELRRRTLALPTKTFHVNASKPKPFATTEKFEKNGL